MGKPSEPAEQADDETATEADKLWGAYEMFSKEEKAAIAEQEVKTNNKSPLASLL